jgi:8-oxo-dGTP pyrophosphatase MutT (NUDIX family)
MRSSPDVSLLRDRDGFLERVIESLAREPVDYRSRLEFIQGPGKGPRTWEGGGVLLPLYFQENENSQGKASGQYVFLLSKRSARVRQPGDLCAPGGGFHPFLDSLSGKILQLGLLPGIRGRGLEGARRRGKKAYEKILFILGNALRESWEELRLSPFNVEFLGPLPVYALQSRRWIIFPLVGRVKHRWNPKLSWEVEKMVSIPLEAFFHRANYAAYSLEVPEKLINRGIPNPWEFPCFVHEERGGEEILWGATFMVIQTFFRIVFDFSFPSPDTRRVIRKPLASNYLSGSEDP